MARSCAPSTACLRPTEFTLAPIPDAFDPTQGVVTQVKGREGCIMPGTPSAALETGAHCRDASNPAPQAKSLPFLAGRSELFQPGLQFLRNEVRPCDGEEAKLLSNGGLLAELDA